jgi:hypothetical protein
VKGLAFSRANRVVWQGLGFSRAADGRRRRGL